MGSKRRSLCQCSVGQDEARDPGHTSCFPYLRSALHATDISILSAAQICVPEDSACHQLLEAPDHSPSLLPTTGSPYMPRVRLQRPRARSLGQLGRKRPPRAVWHQLRRDRPRISVALPRLRGARRAATLFLVSFCRVLAKMGRVVSTSCVSICHAAM